VFLHAKFLYLAPNALLPGRSQAHLNPMPLLLGAFGVAIKFSVRARIGVSRKLPSLDRPRKSRGVGSVDCLLRSAGKRGAVDVCTPSDWLVAALVFFSPCVARAPAVLLGGRAGQDTDEKAMFVQRLGTDGGATGHIWGAGSEEGAEGCVPVCAMARDKQVTFRDNRGWGETEGMRLPARRVFWPLCHVVKINNGLSLPFERYNI